MDMRLLSQSQKPKTPPPEPFIGPRLPRWRIVFRYHGKRHVQWITGVTNERDALTTFIYGERPDTGQRNKWDRIDELELEY